MTRNEMKAAIFPSILDALVKHLDAKGLMGAGEFSVLLDTAEFATNNRADSMFRESDERR